MERKKLTITDIAKLSETSRSTVSRVLNGSDDVSINTRQKILSIIKEEGYIPSAVARGLSMNQSNLIGVVVPAVDNPFFGAILRSITSILDETEYIMMCYNTDDNYEKDMKALDVISRFQVQGLLYTPAVDYGIPEQKENLVKKLRALNAPVVLMDRKIEDLDLSGVYFKDTDAVYEATNKLIDAGHKDIGFISGTKGTYLPRIREKGYIKALEENDIALSSDYLVYGDYDFETSYNISKKMLELSNRPTAVITSNNMTTNTFLKALHERGESSPHDIVIIGLDEIETLNIVDKNFNYIERDAALMGKEATTLLLNDIEKNKEGIVIETKEKFLDAPVKIRNITKGGMKDE